MSSNQLTEHRKSQISQQIHTLILRGAVAQEASSAGLDYCCKAAALTVSSVEFCEWWVMGVGDEEVLRRRQGLASSWP
jgi:hypothetical protein